MRIGFFTDAYLPRHDGIAISVETFRKQLEELGHEVFVFCPDRPENTDTSNPRIIRFRSLPAYLYEGYRNTFPFSRKHYQSIAALKLDIVHLHTPLQIGILGRYVARRNNLPLVITCHSDPGLFEDYKWGKPIVIMALGLATLRRPNGKTDRHPSNPVGFNNRIRAYFNQFDLVIAPSKKIYGNLRKLGVQSPMKTLPTGFDPSMLPPNTLKRQFRQAYKLADEQIIFMSTSRLVKEKRIDFLLRSFAIAAKGNPSYIYLIAGDGPKRKSLERLAKRLGFEDQVKFLGKLEHRELVASLYNADVLISASLRETQGLVFNEAAAVGLPIIALENDINPVVQHGKSAIVPTNNADEYAIAMLSLAADSAKRQLLGKRAKELASRYDAREQARKLVQLYNELLHSAIHS